MATISPTPLPVNLWVILSESKRIINAHSRHFLALSLLFILPISFSATVYPSVVRLITDQSTTFHNTVSLLRSGFHEDQPPNAATDIKTVLLLLLAYIVFATVFNLLAIGSITYSVFQGFYGRPVKLIPAVKSSFTSFFPLFATLITTNFIIFGSLLILGFSVFLLISLIQLDYSSLISQALFVIVMIIWIAIMIKLSINWFLSWVVVVVESIWGFKSLKRSKNLIKGMKTVSISVIFFFAITKSILSWISNSAASAQINEGNLCTNVFFVLQIVITSALLTLLMLYNLAAITVMYMYCKANQGELASEIAGEFERDYVSLPFDDGKVPNLVSLAYNNV